MAKEFPWLDEFEIEHGVLLSCNSARIVRSDDGYIVAHSHNERIFLETCRMGEIAIEIATPYQEDYWKMEDEAA